MKDPEEDPKPQKNIISIVGEIERRRKKQERKRVAASHLRDLESSMGVTEQQEEMEKLDIEDGLGKLGELPEEEAKSARAMLRTVRGLRSCLRGDSAAGLAEWAEVIEEGHDVGTAYLFRARWRMHTDPSSALDDFDRAVAAKPSEPNMYARRGDCHAALGDHQRALANYRRALGLDSKLFDVHRSMGQALVACGEHRKALVAYDRAIRLAPRYVDFYLERSAIREHLDDIVAAIQDLDRVLALDPTRIDTRIHRAFLLVRTGDVTVSSAAFEEVLGELETDQAQEVLSLVGKARVALGQTEQAIKDLSRALELAPDDVSALAQRGRARWLRGDHQSALDDFDRVIELEPGEAKHHVSRANVLAKLERMADAVVALSRALELTPNDPEAYALRAIYRSHSEDTDEGVVRVKEDLGRAIELAPTNVIYPRKRGEYLMARCEYTEALADIDKALALAPDVAQLHFDRGFCKSRLDEEHWPPVDESKEDMIARCTSALADLERAFELGKHDEDIYYELVRVREGMGDNKAHLAMLDRAIAAVPDSMPFRVLRADRRQRAGDADGAAADRAHLLTLGFQWTTDGIQKISTVEP